MSNHPNGNAELPTPEELFALTAELAGFAQDLAKRTALVQTVAVNTIEKLDNLPKKLDGLSSQLSREGADIRNLCASSAVAKTTAAANSAVQDIHSKSATVLTDLRKQLDGTTTALLMRSASFSVGLALGAIVLLVAAWRFIPTLDEVKARRAVTNGIELLRSETDGEVWAVVKEPLRCEKKLLRTTCYGRLK